MNINEAREQLDSKLKELLDECVQNATTNENGTITINTATLQSFADGFNLAAHFMENADGGEDDS